METKALSKCALLAENNHHQIRLKDDESVEKLLAERDASSARLREVIATFRRLVKGSGGKEGQGRRYAHQC